MTAPDTAARHLDLRLALAAGAAWLTAALLIGRSPWVVGAAGGGAGVVGLGTLLVRRATGRLARTATSVSLAGFALAAVLVPAAARDAVGRESPLVRLAERHAGVRVEIVVRGDPRSLASRGAGGVPRVSIDAAARAVWIGGRRVAARGDVVVLAPGRDWVGLLPGQRVRVDATLLPSLDRRTRLVVAVARGAPVAVGSAPWWQRAAGRVRASLRSAAAVLPSAPGGLLPGLVDGDTSSLDPVLREHFRVAGMTHLVAVSGANCAILLGALLLALRSFRLRPRAVAGAGLLVVVAFVVVARPSPSVLRAAVMAVTAMLALAAGRPRDGLAALGAAVLGLLIWSPALATDAGFAMSVAATASLLLVAPGWAAALRRHRVPAGVAEAVAVASAAHLATAPIAAAVSGSISLVAVPANVLAEPAVALATVLGFTTALAATVWLPAGRWCAELAGWPCRWLVWVADFFGAAPGAAVPWPAGSAGGIALAVTLATGCALARRAGVRRLLLVAALAAALVQFPVREVITRWPPPGTVLVVCDVGQGDGLVVPVGDRDAVVVDAGPEPIAIDRCLHDLGVLHVPLLVLTHLHLDHVGGIAGVVRGRRVDRVVSGPLAAPAEGLRLVRSVLDARGLALEALTEGAEAVVGGARFLVLGPRTAFHGTRSDPNNSSLVLRASVRGIRLLLAADAEVEAQRAILAGGIDVRADVLKVAHHGSAYFDPAFLAAVGARVAAVSVGLNNDYGHPAPTLLRALERLGVPVRRTDLDGDVAVAVVDGRLRATVRGRHMSGAGRGSARSTPRPPLVGVSAAGVRMDACRPVPSASTTSPIHYPQWCCSSATRSCWSVARSARSPPQVGVATPPWSRANSWAAN